MQIEHSVDHRQQHARNRISDAFGYRSVGAARELSIKILPVYRRIAVPRLHRQWVDLRYDDHVAAACIASHQTGLRRSNGK